MNEPKVDNNLATEMFKRILKTELTNCRTHERDAKGMVKHISNYIEGIAKKETGTDSTSGDKKK